MPKLQFSEKIIKNANCPLGKAKQVLIDSCCKNLLCEIRPNGRKTYFLLWQNAHGKRRLIRIGDACDITVKQAQQLANQYRSKIALGEDPRAEKVLKKTVPTFEQFIAERYMPFVRGYKKAADSDDSYLRNQILPALGRKHLDEISKIDIIEFHHGLLKKNYRPGTCNRSLILLRYAFNLAIRWEIPGVKTNPTKDVPLFNDQEGKKERFLTKEETERLYGVLKASDNPLLQYIVPMLILTGARKREVLDARWEDFDLQKRQWRIPITKAGHPRYVPLSNGVINLLANVPHDEKNPWVFPNPKTGKPYQSIFGSWNTARKAAGLGDLRIHDLRHSFASFLVNAGRSLYEVQKILGHSQIKTTQRYAHLSQDTLLDAVDAANQVAGSISYTADPLKPDQLGYRNV